MTLANRIAVMDRGRIRQIGTPTEIYEYPKTRFVADFIGSINMLDGRVDSADDGHRPRRGARARRRSRPAPSPASSPGRRSRSRSARRRSPSPASARTAPNAVEGVVEDLGYFGKDSLYRVRLASGRILSVTVDQRPPRRRARARRPVGGPGLARLRSLRRDPAAGGARCVSGCARWFDRSGWRRTIIGVPYLWLARLLPAAVPDRRRDEPRDAGDDRAALRLRAGLPVRRRSRTTRGCSRTASMSAPSSSRSATPRSPRSSACCSATRWRSA